MDQVIKMYFFSDKKLARDLHKGIVTEKEQLVYLLIVTFLSAIFMTTAMGYAIYGYGSQPPSLYSYLGDAVYLTVIFFAIFSSFKKNQAGDGRNFIERYICLSAPIAIKFTILGLILGVFSVVVDFALYALQNPEIGEALLNDDSQNTDFIEQSFAQMPLGPGYLGAMVLVMLYYYWRYITAFKIASGQKEYE